MRPILVAVLAILPSAAQIVDLATMGDGAEAYFATNLTRKGTGDPVQGRIYKTSSGGVGLVAARDRVDPASPPPYTSAFSNYYDLSRPEVSRDGKVVAYNAHRNCVGGRNVCYIAHGLQTSVRPTPGSEELLLDGAGRLSGNGRYVFLYATGSQAATTLAPTIVDLQTGARIEGSPAGQWQASSTGRVVADDGTAVFTDGNSLFLMTNGVVEKATAPLESHIYRQSEPVIDAAAESVVYTALIDDKWRRALYRYRIAEKRHELFLGGNGDIYAPSISADGQRVMFLSTVQFGTQYAPSVAQVYVVNLDGTGFQRVSGEWSGVRRAILSDDGRVVWYVSATGRLMKVNLETGAIEEKVGRTPALGYTAVVPGSVIAVAGEGLADAELRADRMPLPLELGGTRVKINGVQAPLLSVSPTEIVFQAPWETPSSTAGVMVDMTVETTADSPFEATVAQQDIALTTLPEAVELGPDPADPSGASTVFAIHENWDALVTLDKPAQPGEIINFYATGLGPVVPAVETGAPGPAHPPAATALPLTCKYYLNGQHASTLSLYAGLAPGLVGYYQVSMRIPTDAIPDMYGHFVTGCFIQGVDSGLQITVPIRR